MSEQFTEDPEVYRECASETPAECLMAGLRDVNETLCDAAYVAGFQLDGVPAASQELVDQVRDAAIEIGGRYGIPAPDITAEIRAQTYWLRGCFQGSEVDSIIDQIQDVYR